MGQSYSFSIDKKRNFLYSQFMQSCENGNLITIGSMVTLGSKLMRQAKLHPHFFENNSLEATARYLACFAVGVPYDNSSDHVELNPIEAKLIIEVFEKRIAMRIPVEYITNEAWYMGNKFYVNEHVLVPRSLMSEHFKDFLATNVWENYRVLDLCTGSGCIGITLALMNPQIKVDLVDLSVDALNVANSNIRLHSLEDRVQCLQSDVFKNVNGKYDLIITNPPYVTTKDYNQVPQEFKAEPRMALESGKDGLTVIHQILAQAPQYLNPHGRVIAEVGYPAAKLIKKKYPSLNLTWLGYKKPSALISWFDKWITPIINMDCIFILGT